MSLVGVTGTVRDERTLLAESLPTAVVVIVPDSEIDRDFRVVALPTPRSTCLERKVELNDWRRGAGDPATLNALGLEGEWRRRPAICASWS